MDRLLDLLPSLVLLVIGVVFCAIGLGRWAAHRRRLRSWLRVPGQVVGVRRRGASGSVIGGPGDGPDTYPVFTYTGPDGVARRAENPTPDTIREALIPFDVEVLVDPRDPARVRLGTRRYGGGAIGPAVTGFGVLIVLVGVVVLVVRLA